MRKFTIAALIFLFSMIAGAQTTVTGSHVYDGNSAYAPLVSGTICFGVSPCFSITNGAFSGSVTNGTYTVQVTDNTSAVILTMNGIVLAGGTWVFDNYQVPAAPTPQVSGKGVPYFQCAPNALYTITNPPIPPTGLQVFPRYVCGDQQHPNVWYNANQYFGQNTQLIAIYGQGAPTGACTNGTVYYNTATSPIQQYVCINGQWQPTGGGGSSGVTQAQGNSPILVNGDGAPHTGAITVSCPTCSTGGGGGGPAIDTNTTPNASQAVLSFRDTNSVQMSNPSGGIENATVNPAVLPYNPPSAVYFFASFSGLYDDNHTLSSAVPVSTYTVSGSTVTVFTTAAHNMVAGDYVDVHTMTGWPNANQEPALGSFKILSTGLTSTQFQFTYTGGGATSCSSSCGNVYNANYWAIYQAANQPWIKNHGSVLGVEAALSTIATSFNSLVNCSAGSPTYLIIEGGQNDFNNGDSAATVEGHLQSIWSQAHTAGCIVVQGTVTGANYGGSPTFNFGIYPAVNRWIMQQAKSFSNTSGGQYWDRVIDYNSFLYDNNLMILGSDPNAALQFGQRTNDAFAKSSSSVTGPGEVDTFQGGSSSILHAMPTIQYWIDNVNNAWMYWGCCGNNGNFLGIMNNYPGNGPSLSLWQPNAGTNSCPVQIGGAFALGNFPGTTNDGSAICFHWVGSGSTSNTVGFSFINNGPVFLMKATGDAYFPELPGLPGSGSVPLSIDTTGKLIPGSSSTPSTFDETWTTDISSNPFTVNSTTAWSKATFTVALANTMPNTSYTGECSVAPPTGTVSAGAPVMLVYSLVPISTSSAQITLQNGDTTAAVVTTTARVSCHIHPN